MRGGELRHEDAAAPPLEDFLWVRRLEEQTYGLSQIGQGPFDRATLTCDVELGAEADVRLPFLFDDGREESLGLGVHAAVSIAGSVDSRPLSGIGYTEVQPDVLSLGY